jgi:hypothetical protein
VIELSSYMSKFPLYNKYLKELGWEYTCDHKSWIVKKESMEFDALEEYNMASWEMFLKFWGEHYDHRLKIQKLAKDIC